MTEVIYACPVCAGPVPWESWRVDEDLLSVCCGVMLRLTDAGGVLALEAVDVAPAGEDAASC